MPIQIIDNFDLGAAKPIDNRIVVGSQSFYTDKDSIDHKYAGMRVWDLDLGVPFVWTGTTFSSENSISLTGVGTSNFIPKFVTSNVLTDSIIFQTVGGNIGLSNTVPAYKLDVNGDIRSSGNLRGNGQFITQIDAGNISSGSLSLARLTNGTSGQVLLAGVSQPQWSSTNSLSVGTASNVVITDDTASSTQYITFVDGTSGSRSVKVSSTKLQFTPSSGNLYISGNLGLGGSPSDKLLVVGTSNLNGNTTVTGQLRVNRNGTSAFVVGYTSGQTNLQVDTSSTTTGLSLLNPSSPTTQKISFTQYSGYSEILSSGQTYFNVLNSDERLMQFGRAGSNGQVRFYMDTSTLTVPTVGGTGVYIQNNLRVDGTLSKASGSFQIEHPLESKKSTHTLVHSFIEGPQADNIYRGKAILQAGFAQINLDENSKMTDGTFVALNRDIQCFTTNEFGWTSVKGKVVGNILIIESEDPNSTDVISWLVIGERQDKHMYETNWTDANGKVIVEPLKV